MPLTDREARERVARVESLLEQIDAIGDRRAREMAVASVQALLDLYGEGLARLVGHVAAQCGGADEERLATALAGDELVSHLLMLHGLHPEDVKRRVEGALERVRPYLKSHGGDVELVAVKGSTVRLRLQGSCHGCPSSAATLRTTVEDAILEAAPEIFRVETDDETSQSSDTPLVPLVRSRSGRSTRAVVSAAG
jgi:Fe-S cluster biogenesis protein NfuA